MLGDIGRCLVPWLPQNLGSCVVRTWSESCFEVRVDSNMKFPCGLSDRNPCGLPGEGPPPKTGCLKLPLRLFDVSIYSPPLDVTVGKTEQRPPSGLSSSGLCFFFRLMPSGHPTRRHPLPSTSAVWFIGSPVTNAERRPIHL